MSDLPPSGAKLNPLHIAGFVVLGLAALAIGGMIFSPDLIADNLEGWSALRAEARAREQLRENAEARLIRQVPQDVSAPPPPQPPPAPGPLYPQPILRRSPQPPLREPAADDYRQMRFPSARPLQIVRPVCAPGDRCYRTCELDPTCVYFRCPSAAELRSQDAQIEGDAVTNAECARQKVWVNYDAWHRSR